MRSEGIFTPPSVQGTVTFQRNLGGMNCSGAFEPARQIFVTNVNNLPMGSPPDPTGSLRAGRAGRHARANSALRFHPARNTHAMSRRLLRAPSRCPAILGNMRRPGYISSLKQQDIETYRRVARVRYTRKVSLYWLN